MTKLTDEQKKNLWKFQSDAPLSYADAVEKAACFERDSEIEDLKAQVKALGREAHTWSKACENASTVLHILRTPSPKLRVEFWNGEGWIPLRGIKLDQVIAEEFEAFGAAVAETVVAAKPLQGDEQ